MTYKSGQQEIHISIRKLEICWQEELPWTVADSPPFRLFDKQSSCGQSLPKNCRTTMESSEMLEERKKVSVGVSEGGSAGRWNLE